MPGIAAIADTYNSPNYVGELFLTSPVATPFLSAIGGLTGGRSTDSNIFTWQSADLRTPGVRVHQEGADAGVADTRVRSLISNVCEVHLESVAVTYSRLGGAGMVTTRGASPYVQPLGTNPVQDELAFQISMKLKELALDINASFINGRKVLPSDNKSPRKTGGIIEAVGANIVDVASVVEKDLTSTDDTINSTGTKFANDDKVIMRHIGTLDPSVVSETVVYFVVGKTANGFKVAKTKGGAPIQLGAGAGIEVAKPSTTDMKQDNINVDLLEPAFARGAEGNRALLVNSRQKVALSKAFNGAQFWETNRQVGGVAVQQLVTDFGIMNILMDRAVPQDTAIALSLDSCAPVFKEIPNRGYVFSEELARTGDSIKYQLYAECGLQYGDPNHLAIIRGLAV